MGNSSNDNDPRLRQDKFERKDKENSNAGMYAGIVIVLLALVGLFLYYNYEVAPETAAIPQTTTSVPASEANNPNTTNATAPAQPATVPAPSDTTNQ